MCVEKGAGQGSSIPDAEFKEAGATIAATAADTVSGADIVLKVQRPMIAGEKEDELSILSSGQSLVCQMNALTDEKFVDAMAKAGITGFAMELMPRISRAQSMDVFIPIDLSGYKAVLDAALNSAAFPMMMTAAGTVPMGASVGMGAGVAGLQAIATHGDWVPLYRRRTSDKKSRSILGTTFVAVEDDTPRRRRPQAVTPRKGDIYKKAADCFDW